MSDERRPPDSSDPSSALDALSSEARKHLSAPDMDWARIEARLMARVEDEKPALAREAAASRRRAHLLRFGAVALAAAAAVALVARKPPEAPVSEREVPKAFESGSVSTLRGSENASPGGRVRIGDTVVGSGHALSVGDTVEVDGGRPVFDRPNKVVWVLESENGVARARVKSAGESLILGLEHGAIEAQVTPVLAGEAFAVDIATDKSLVRVAVHGTHLRVDREGSRIVVDLTEGVVSIGVPPRTGVTYGTLVTAPAHVEFDAADLGTLKVDHSMASVRAPIPLGPHEPVALAQQEPSAPSPKAPAPPATAGGGPSRPSAHDKAGDAPAASPASPAPPPREAIAKAVRECAAARSRPGTVRVTVTSSLRIGVSPRGTVESAVFDPPLLPEIQSCAAQVIYKTKIDEPGTLTVPIEFSY